MKRLLPLILTAAVLLSCCLAACGEKNNGASPDTTATADESVSGSTSSSASQGTASAPSNGDSASSKTGGSSASSAGSNGGSSSAAQTRPKNAGGGEQKSSSAPEQRDQGSSKQASSGSSASQPASSAAPNPAYEDDEKPSFTIVLIHKTKKTKYSAACSYTDEKEEQACAAFFLPGGSYDVAVYEYADSIDKSEPLATDTYVNDIDANKRKSIKVYYIPEDNKIEFKESTSSRNQ